MKEKKIMTGLRCRYDAYQVKSKALGERRKKFDETSV